MTVFALMTIMRIPYNTIQPCRNTNIQTRLILTETLCGTLCQGPSSILFKVVPLLPTSSITEVIAPTMPDNIIGNLFPRNFGVAGIRAVGQLANSFFQ